jgi:hypothetical protein
MEKDIGPYSDTQVYNDGFEFNSYMSFNQWCDASKADGTKSAAIQGAINDHLAKYDEGLSALDDMDNYLDTYFSLHAEKHAGPDYVPMKGAVLEEPCSKIGRMEDKVIVTGTLSEFPPRYYPTYDYDAIYAFYLSRCGRNPNFNTVVPHLKPILPKSAYSRRVGHHTVLIGVSTMFSFLNPDEATKYNLERLGIRFKVQETLADEDDLSGYIFTGDWSDELYAKGMSFFVFNPYAESSYRYVRQIDDRKTYIESVSRVGRRICKSRWPAHTVQCNIYDIETWAMHMRLNISVLDPYYQCVALISPQVYERAPSHKKYPLFVSPVSTKIELICSAGRYYDTQRGRSFEVEEVDGPYYSWLHTESNTIQYRDDDGQDHFVPWTNADVSQEEGREIYFARDKVSKYVFRARIEGEEVRNKYLMVKDLVVLDRYQANARSFVPCLYHVGYEIWLRHLFREDTPDLTLYEVYKGARETVYAREMTALTPRQYVDTLVRRYFEGTGIDEQYEQKKISINATRDECAPHDRCECLITINDVIMDVSRPYRICHALHQYGMGREWYHPTRNKGLSYLITLWAEVDRDHQDGPYVFTGGKWTVSEGY